jgi:hypothetical protein
MFIDIDDAKIIDARLADAEEAIAAALTVCREQVSKDHNVQLAESELNSLANSVKSLRLMVRRENKLS